MKTQRREKRRIVRWLILSAALAWILFLPGDRVFAEDNFIITDYDIQMVVSEDDTYQITETLKVHFTEESHGIYRTIPRRQDVSRDGQRSRYYGDVKDFEMLSDQPWEDDSEGGVGDDFVAKIGDPDKYAPEDTTYKFRYIFDNGGDHLEGADELYYNLVGTIWEARSIDKVTFRVEFPKTIDESKVGIKTGGQVSVPFEMEGDRTIKGSTAEDTLEGLTIRAVLPEGYFTAQAEEKQPRLPFYLLTWILGILTLVGLAFWRKYGEDDPVVETVEFYPPENLSPPEIGYLADGNTDSRHVISMLLTLAEKGYLKIVDKDEKNDYEIVRLKAYDGETVGEAAFMDGLFPKGRTKARKSDLQDTFYETINKIKKKIDGKYEGKLYEKKTTNAAIGLWLVAGAGVIALFLITRLTNGYPLSLYGIWGLALGVLQTALVMVGFYMIGDDLGKGERESLFYLLWAGFSLAGIVIAGVSGTFVSWQVPLFFPALAMCLLLNIMAGICLKKSEWYTRILGKIRGYRTFLRMAEKDRIEMLAEEDPEYFYKNLAYAYALGVTGFYVSRFASLAEAPPDWYDSPYIGGGEAFDSGLMMNSLNGMMYSINKDMTSVPSDSDSGGGSFDGGGGAGGGGGGSW